MWTTVDFRVKLVDSTKINLSRLRALRAEKPATQMGQVRWAWPDIKAALASGHALTTIHGRLQEIGINVSYRRLSLYIGRLRKEERNTLGPSVQTQSLATQLDPAASTRDPLANVRRYGNPRGFDWDEAPPDRNKLI